MIKQSLEQTTEDSHMAKNWHFLKQLRKLEEAEEEKIKKRIKKIGRKMKKFAREQELLRHELTRLHPMDDKTPTV